MSVNKVSDNSPYRSDWLQQHNLTHLDPPILLTQRLTCQGNRLGRLYQSLFKSRNTESRITTCGYPYVNEALFNPTTNKLSWNMTKDQNESRANDAMSD